MREITLPGGVWQYDPTLPGVVPVVLVVFMLDMLKAEIKWQLKYFAYCNCKGFS